MLSAGGCGVFKAFRALMMRGIGVVAGNGALMLGLSVLGGG